MSEPLKIRILDNTDSQELIQCDDWDYALNKYKQLE